MVTGSAPDAPSLVLVLSHESIEPKRRAVELLPAERAWLPVRIVSMSRLSSLEALANWYAFSDLRPALSTESSVPDT